MDDFEKAKLEKILDRLYDLEDYILYTRSPLDLDMDYLSVQMGYVIDDFLCVTRIGVEALIPDRNKSISLKYNDLCRSKPKVDTDSQVLCLKCKKPYTKDHKCSTLNKVQCNGKQF